MNFYRNESSDAKWNAQRNLSGRTHYVDDDTLRFHKSRVLSSRDHANGLLFSIVESCALDMRNTRRGFRFVIFDVFGNVISRCDLDECYTTGEKARKALYEALNAIDAHTVTSAAIDAQERANAREIERARADLAELTMKKAA